MSTKTFLLLYSLTSKRHPVFGFQVEPRGVVQALVHFAYSYFEDKLPEDFQPLKKVSVPLENYWGGDCAAYLSFDFEGTESARRSV